MFSEIQSVSMKELDSQENVGGYQDVFYHDCDGNTQVYTISEWTEHVKWVHFIICKLYLNKGDFKMYISPLHYTLEINWLMQWITQISSPHYNCLKWVFISANTTKTTQGKWNNEIQASQPCSLLAKK